MKPARRIIAVIGDNACDARTAKTAEEVGRLLAQKGAVVLTGGYGGVMEAASRGAKKAGGLTMAILSGKDRERMNPWVDLPVVTGMRHARNAAIAFTADGVIAVSGGYGTLSEISFALLASKPVVGLKSWKIHRRGSAASPFSNVSTPLQAVQLLFRKLS